MDYNDESKNYASKFEKGFKSNPFEKLKGLLKVNYGSSEDTEDNALEARKKKALSSYAEGQDSTEG